MAGAAAAAAEASKLDAGLCSACGRAAVFKCSRCLVARYCAEPCQRAAWPSHKLACAQLRAEALIRVERLVFDVTSQPPRVLLRPTGDGEPAELTAAQLKAPLGRFPYGQAGGSVPPQAVMGHFTIGVSVALQRLEEDDDEDLKAYVAGAAVLGGGRLKLNACTVQSDTMFTIPVLIERWEKSGGALWRVEDAVAVVLERFRVKHEASAKGIIWGAAGLNGFWAVVVEGGGENEQKRFSLCPHLGYHFTADAKSGYSSCAIA
jgi:hypothetical protein